jgi:hypothetical protein
VNKENIITGNAFKNIADDFLDEEKTFLDLSKTPKIIFLKTDWIELFKNKILPKINYPFKLITHNADRPCPSGNLDLLNDEKLVRWFGMNCDINHNKLQPIPIGLANEKWTHGNKEILIEVIKQNIEKKKLAYCNFDISTNFNKRNDVHGLIKNKNFIDVDPTKLPFQNYLQKLSEYKYVISPPGNSVDCHRIWESIYLGVIPIVEKHLCHDYWNDLPILFVNSFNDINEKILNENYETLISKSNEKAQMLHYKEMIKS